MEESRLGGAGAWSDATAKGMGVDYGLIMWRRAADSNAGGAPMWEQAQINKARQTTSVDFSQMGARNTTAWTSGAMAYVGVAEEGCG